MLQLYPIPAVFELQTILRHVHCMTQMTLNTKRSKVPHIHVTTTTVSNVTLFRLYFETSAVPNCNNCNNSKNNMEQ